MIEKAPTEQINKQDEHGSEDSYDLVDGAIVSRHCHSYKDMTLLAYYQVAEDP